MTAQDELVELEAGASLESALEFFDALPPARVAELTGTWRGNGIDTGNPFDGLLERFGWYGKRFDGPDDAHPLLFTGSGGRVVSVNPAFVPMRLVLNIADELNNPVVGKLFTRLVPLLTTREPRARLRMVEYRGVSSAAMIYDSLPIYDPFRKVDENTLLGAMDLRGLRTPFMFVLRRDAATG